MTDASRRPRSWQALVVLLGIVAVAGLLRLRLLVVPLERDEGEYAYMGQLILRGELPYVAGHNMKLPGVYYTYAAILSLFGETDVGIRLGLLMINAATIVLVYVLGRRLLDETAGLGAAAAYAALSLSDSVSGFTANAEHFVVLPMLAGVVLLLRPRAERGHWRVAAAGVLLGTAFVMKQHGAPFIACGALWLLGVDPVQRRAAWRARLLDCLVFALGALAPFACACLGMYLAGAFAPFWFWTFTYAGKYAALMPVDIGLAWLRREATRIVGASVALWALAAIGLVAPLWDRQARQRAGIVGAFVACSLLAIVPGLRFSDHYFVLILPAASLLVAEGAGALTRMVAAGHSGFSRALRIGLLLAAVGLTLAQHRAYLFSLTAVEVSKAVFRFNPFPEAVEIARYLREHSDPDDRVAVIGSEPEIYFYARRRAATSYLYTYPLMEPQPFAVRMQEEMIAQIERERPRFLVLVNVPASWTMRPESSRMLLDWAERLVDAEYDAVGFADMLPDHETVYYWGDAARGVEPRSSLYVAVFRRRGS